MIPFEDPASTEVWAQGIGFLGTLGGVLWPLMRSRTGMLAVQAADSAIFALHYLLIGADTGAYMNLLSAGQAAAAIPLGHNRWFRYVYLALLPVIAFGLSLTWHGTPSLFAAAATALMSLGRYQLSIVHFRVYMALAIPCWFTHNIMVQSYPGMASDVAGMAINGIMLFRILTRHRDRAAAT